MTNAPLDHLTIKNFQSHRASELQFVNGVNVIIGASDAGKSSVFRALNWVLTNRPLGDAFRSEWGGETRVELRTMMGEEVVRSKDKNANTYQIQGTELKAFGSEPPEDVLQVLAMDDINIQGQTDPPFLLTTSPGETAQILNKAAAIDDIDLVIRNLKRSQDNLRRDIRSGENWLKEQEEQLTQYNNLPELERLVEGIENLEQERNATSTHKSKLSSIIQKIQRVEEELQKTKNLKVVEKHYTKAQSLSGELERAQEQRHRLASVISSIENLGRKIETLDNRIKADQKEYNKIAPEVCPLCNGTGNPRGGLK